MNKILFMGRKPVASQALMWLIKRPDVSVVGVITDSHLLASPTADVATENSIPIFTREEAKILVLKGELEYNIGVSVLFWQKIFSEFIENAHKGIINFHPAPLPDFKGTAGYNVAILEKHSRWAISAHYVDDDFDTGDIISVKWFDIDHENETAQTLERKAQRELFEQFKDVMGSALMNENTLPTKPNIGGRYISRAEMEKMKEVFPGDDVERKIRAFWFPPYDGAYIVLDGVKCTLIHQPILKTLADPTVSSLFVSKAGKKEIGS